MPTPSVLDVIWGNIDAITWPIATVVVAYRLASAWESFRPLPLSSNPSAPEEIPEDLVALAMQQSESWAQEDLLRVIRERYDDLRDWNRVRSAMNIGRMAG